MFRAVPNGRTITADPAWLIALSETAPDFSAAYRRHTEERYLAVKRECAARSGLGTAVGLAVQHAAVTKHLNGLLSRADASILDEKAAPTHWNVAQTVGHAIAAREGLALAAMLAAARRWPSQAPTVEPGVAGQAASVGELRASLARSQRFLERAATRIAGHELDPCELEHPLVGRFRCGGWLLFAGVHDLMHVAQLESLVARSQPLPQT